MIAEPYKDDPNEGNTCHSEDPLCYDRSVYTNLEPKTSNFRLLIGAITQAWEAISSHIPTFVDFSEMTFKDVKEAFKDIWGDIMNLMTLGIFNGKKVKYSHVDAFIEWRHGCAVTPMVNLFNVIGTAALGITPLTKCLGIPPIARRIIGLSHLAVVTIGLCWVELFLPRPTENESGLPVIFLFAYGFLVSAFELALVLISDWGGSMVWLDFAFSMLSLLLWWGLISNMSIHLPETQKAIVEIARRDYGALDLKFFNDVQKSIKK